MKTSNLIKLLLLSVVGMSIPLAAQIDLPPQSPMAKIVQQVGYTEIDVEYNRPSRKGRMIFGELVPYGQVWRTGANECTKITFSKDISLEDHKVKAGRYALFTIPGEEEWTIILNKNIDAWGTRDYDPSDDVLRFKVKPTSSSYHFETFTIDVGELTTTSATLQLMWANTIVRIHLGTDADEHILAEIDRRLDNPMLHLGNTYFAAAAYYLQTHRDIDQALEWVDEAIKINGKNWRYLHLKAEIMAERGEYLQAMNLGREAASIAREDGKPDQAKIAELSIEKWKKMSRAK